MGDSEASGTLDNSAAVEITGKIMVIAIIILFLVVVFVLFLHLYAKWFWWRVEEPPPQGLNRRRPRRRFVFVPGQEMAAVGARRGLDPSVLRSIPVIAFRPEEFKDGLECAVCLSELVDGEKARLLPKCNHGFHVDCIDMWFQSHSTCPLCRNSVHGAPESRVNVGPEEDSVESVDESVELSVEDISSGGHTTESLRFPTNVLFWGDDTQVSSRTGSLEEGPVPWEEPATPSASSSIQPDGALVIDIPRRTMESTSSFSPSTSGCVQDEVKSPMTTRLRSLKRLLSRERRVNPCSPTSADAEQVGRSLPC
ncbi:RING-H2 finger protein ATL3 [Rhodamnia argentea]|uniref:RING-type E3 ubiquitin transferase n=1 Tax=Rhodamnia argentea TaxID=178133 RepID=A0A8B8NN45_9MYRT|nr:RING-H2 finger protein ATL3 [Rhodamnia argentea]